MPTHSVAVVILNYNGRLLLEKFLTRVVADSAPYPVIIADNASTDDSLSYISANHPTVGVVRNSGNHGYAGGYNEALKQVSADVYVLLNNDVETSAHWLEAPLALMAQHEDIGACQPLIASFADKTMFEYAGAAGGFIDRLGYPFCRGRLFNHLEVNSGQYAGTADIFWASGACMFVRRKAFEEAGGFDASYFAHMEEIDLCWRMRNLGYTICATGDSVVYHVGGGTLNKISAKKTFLNFSNNLTTLAKNLPSKGLAAKILFRLVLDGVAGLKFLLEGQPAHAFAVIRAHFTFYARISTIRSQRRMMEAHPQFSYRMSQVYSGMVIVEYYLKKKRTFMQLVKPFLR